MISVGQLVLTSLASLMIGMVLAYLTIRWLLSTAKGNRIYLQGVWHQAHDAWAAIAADHPELDFLLACPCCGRTDAEAIAREAAAFKVPRPPIEPPPAGPSAA